MFSFRKRPRANSTNSDASPLKTSPSLPELSPQGIPWPENLVDVSVLRETPPVPELHPYQGAVKSSLHSFDHAPIPFHKPFRQSDQSSETPNAKPSKISSLYMSPHPPSAFETWRSPSSAGTTTRRTQRRGRTPPAFNLMVVGAHGTGKTSLLRLLLDTADLSPAATGDQRAVLDRFLKGGLKHTQTINTACIEICESRYDRIHLTVIDTPGLDFSPGKELSVERQVTNIIKYIDEQYAATMNEESKVIRQSRGDQHVHLCIFMVDPTLTRNVTRGQFVHERSVSESTVIFSQAAHQADEYSGAVMMSPAELRVIGRLSPRVNVLPVIAKADSLTDESLFAVKMAVREGLRHAGLGFGVFSTPKLGEESHLQSTPQEGATNGLRNGVNGASHHTEKGDNGVADDDTEKDRVSRTVITLKGTHAARSRSRSRRDLSSIAQDEREPQYPDETVEDTVANIRFSAQTVTKVNLDTLLPFALIAPEPERCPEPERLRSATADSKSLHTNEDSEGASSPVEPDVPLAARKSTIFAPPESLRGAFTRKFRWGTVDVLNPEHCDFAALRTAILLTHMKVLKAHTREVLYEKYRTEKLLAKRATRTIGPEEAKRLFEDLGL
ncbi:Septin-domain-containing protein [Boletus edulis BED1]|uniref:Septin-domain-containing protein n=1 Tax=Boletus edulis BED1 TaxID=1328754 RepID=A0AAD4BXW7_BOLED|nr:Septin-domain-containing protein [Boletus edulis BED1]